MNRSALTDAERWVGADKRLVPESLPVRVLQRVTKRSASDPSRALNLNTCSST
jgi:hypothetical protein